MLQPKYEVTVEINEDVNRIFLFFAQPITEDIFNNLLEVIVQPYYGFNVSSYYKQDKTYDDICIIYNRNYDVIEVVREIVHTLKGRNYSKFYFKRNNYKPSTCLDLLT